jgi:hypothetical protein
VPHGLESVRNFGEAEVRDVEGVLQPVPYATRERRLMLPDSVKNRVRLRLPRDAPGIYIAERVVPRVCVEVPEVERISFSVALQKASVFGVVVPATKEIVTGAIEAPS